MSGRIVSRKLGSLLTEVERAGNTQTPGQVGEEPGDKAVLKDACILCELLELGLILILVLGPVVAVCA